METPEAMQRVAGMAEAVGASSCFGTPTVAGERVMVPVAEVVFGFGFGWGGRSETAASGEREDDGGGGAGGGARSRGVAVIELTPDGVRVHPIVDETALMLARVAVAAVAVALIGRLLLRLTRGR